MTDPVRQQIVDMLPRLRAFARSLAPSWDQADDLVQQTVEKGLGNLSRFTPGTRLDSWLFRIMRNTWIDTHRATRPVVAIDDTDAPYALIGEDGRQVTEARLELARVRTAMDRLPQDQRAVLLLVCVEGLRYREVAEMLDVPLGTVMSRLARARTALASNLGIAAPDTRRKGDAR
ncbi:RNA polymerase sigma-70 factor, ECF subfamily [Roseovarius pacificus]|uniref:RNA polymerase sigma-70 factor, ECF subfamily n=1 Tax=Roseovarius pacificus TaxID=337701 RepID=A0A1M7BAR0_9RHOB|nr:sigma-70 family RNA polymerase sigma factor [Roseovarius pacificus]GGO54859.1 DNA-directed RNA polymerase sigma-70 factor [Roseovarius pacificus]SHL52024.1 RNA polymerase sigma-70 factor, ECF subfamily [Roseovarius pacificus]